jgi:hypothetical protein
MRSLMLLAALSAVLYAADEQESIHKTLSGARSIEVDNVFGSIHLTGYDGAEIPMLRSAR